MADMKAAPGPLDGVRILDLSRILAGPTMTQLLGDLGADVIKVERPGNGDDTREWGPPYLETGDGDEPGLSSYFLCANRNKRSVAIDISRNEGADLVRKLALECNVLVENFKVGDLGRYGLAYDDLQPGHPGLIYCSITGFGQTGPLAHRPGYDAMIQAMGGVMSLTGEPDGEPMKVGVGVADIVCGLYAGTAILGALRHFDRTGEGQHIDVGLFDTQLAWLVNEAQNYLLTGRVPERRGTAHPNIVPYQVFPASDGYFMLAVGNDSQFRRFCALAGAPRLSEDPKFATNPARIRNRDELIPLIRDLTRSQPVSFWIDKLDEAGVPSGPINDLAQSFGEPQTQAREMRVPMAPDHDGEGTTELVGNPLKMSATPVSYRRFPPRLGEHTHDVLHELLGIDDDEIGRLAMDGVVALDRGE